MSHVGNSFQFILSFFFLVVSLLHSTLLSQLDGGESEFEVIGRGFFEGYDCNYYKTIKLNKLTKKVKLNLFFNILINVEVSIDWE